MSNFVQVNLPRFYSPSRFISSYLEKLGYTGIMISDATVEVIKDDRSCGFFVFDETKIIKGTVEPEFLDALKTRFVELVRKSLFSLAK